MDTAIKSRLDWILTLANQQNWDDERFSPHKSLVCAELCALVYNELREYEIKRASRIHLFASEVFRRQVESGRPRLVLSDLAAGGQFEARTFLVTSRYAVTLGIRLPNVTFLAIRGTVLLRLWDWRA